MAKYNNTLVPFVFGIKESQKRYAEIIKASAPFLAEINRITELYNYIYLPNLTQFTDTVTQQLETSSRLIHSIVEKIIIPDTKFTQFSIDLSRYINKINLDLFDKFLVIGIQLQKRLQVLNTNSFEIAPNLQKANLWLTPSMGFSFLEEIVELAKDAKSTPKDIEYLYTKYYSENDYENLSEMVNSWRHNPFFMDRLDIIDDAKEAHKNKKYSLSIPTLLPIIEGIACSISGVSAGKTTKIIKDVIGNNYPDFLISASKDVFLNLLETMGMFGRIDPGIFSPEGYSKYLSENRIIEEKSFNRHAILHGVQRKYSSELNSLKVFLILDMLSGLKDDTKNE